MSNYSRWKDTIEKHDREDGICPLLDDVYQQGRAEALDEAINIALGNYHTKISAYELEKLKEQKNE